MLFHCPNRGRGGNQQQNFQRRRRAMKTNLVRMAVLVVAAVTMAMPAFAGQSQTSRVFTPDPNDWQYREAMETGNLPSGSEAVKVESGLAENVPTVESAGNIYRIGVDTP